MSLRTEMARLPVAWTIAGLLAVLMLLAGMLAGCRVGSAPCGQTSAAQGGVVFPVYYLYPGEPAPVEGPQMRAADFERFLEAVERNLHSQGDKKL